MQFQCSEGFYARLFAQVFLYLKQFPASNWRAVIIYPNRSIEQKNLDGYRELLDAVLVQRVYLDELPNIETVEDIVGIFKLIIEPKKRTIDVAREFVEKQTPYLNFLEKVIFYKFGNLTAKEILKMIGIREEFEEELKKTRAYQEILREGELTGFKRGIKGGIEEGREMGIKEERKAGMEEGIKEGLLKSVGTLREVGLSDEEIAKRLELDIQDVKRV